MLPNVTLSSPVPQPTYVATATAGAPATGLTDSLMQRVKEAELKISNTKESVDDVANAVNLLAAAERHADKKAEIDRCIERLRRAKPCADENLANLERDQELLAAAVCDLGDDLYLQGQTQAAEAQWARLATVPVRGGPAPLSPPLQANPTWLHERFQQQVGMPEAQALTQMHAAPALGQTGDMLALAVALSERTAAPIRARLALWHLSLAQVSAAEAEVARTPAVGIGLFARAQLNLLQGNTATAAEQFLALAAESSADTFQTDFWASQALMRLQRYADAQPHLERWVVANPHDMPRCLDFGRNHLRLGEYEQGFHLFAQLVPQRDLPEAKDLQPSLAIAVAYLARPTSSDGPPPLLLEPYRARTAISSLQIMLVCANDGKFDRSRQALQGFLSRQMSLPVTMHLLAVAWRELFDGIPSAAAAHRPQAKSRRLPVGAPSPLRHPPLSAADVANASPAS